MPNELPDGTELAYYAKGKKILDGYKQGNGIVCSHCDTEISPTQFEAHAGWAAKRQPYPHIYISNALTLHDIALLLANGQSIATSNSDDMCAVCGDRGELVICDGCPCAFHADCLGLEGVPSDDWHCQYCQDSIGSGRKAAAESRPIVIRLTRVVKAREYETGGCVIFRDPDFSVVEFDDRTVMLCDQCEKEYHVGCLRESGICDLKVISKIILHQFVLLMHIFLQGYFQALFICVEELLLSLGVKLLVLPAAEEAKSIWTKKLGFRKMSD